MVASMRWVWVGFLLVGVMRAQQQDPKAQEMVQVATRTELDASARDHSRWQYKDVYTGESGTKVLCAIETDKGTVKKLLEKDGRPLSPEELKQEDARIEAFIHNDAQLAKQRRDGVQDDKRAENMLMMLPDAFLWSVKSDDGKDVTLSFVPNPQFSPSSMEGKVFSAMAGEIVLDKQQHRMKEIKGHLISDVKFGWGLFGRINAGGTFNVERRELAPGVWQITESHVHMVGKALLFKHIGEQEDEVKSEYRRSPVNDLEQAAVLLKGEPAALNAMR